MSRPTLSNPHLSPSGRPVVTVHSTGGTTVARVDEAVVPAGDPAPGTGSRRWSEVGEYSAGSVVELPRQDTLHRTWVRAAGVTAAGKRVTLYSHPVAIQAPPTPRVDDVRLSVDDGGAVVQWTAEGPVDVVRVRAVVHDDPESGTLGSPLLRPPEDGALSLPDRPAIGQYVTVQVEPVDAGELYLLDGRLVTDEEAGALAAQDPRPGRPRLVGDRRPLDLGTVEEPRHWLFTDGGVPVRGQDFRLVTASGLEPQDDWLMLSDGRPARLITTDIARSAT